MTRLFDRRYKLTVDGVIEVEDLDIGFDIIKSTKKQPNKAEIRVYNMSADTRGKLDGKRDRLGKLTNPVACNLEAGYGSDLTLIFSGDLHTVFTEKQGPDIVTHLASADGLAATRQGNVSFSLKRGSSVADMFKKLGRELFKTGTAKLGNLDQIAGTASITGMGTTFPEGTVVDGPAYDELHRLAESCGLELSIQNGAIQLKPNGRPLNEEAITLSPDSGLIGSPTIEAAQDPGKTKPSEQFVLAQCLMVPGIIPGRKVNLETADKAFNATYECVVVEYHGETFGAEWGCKLKLRPV